VSDKITVPLADPRADLASLRGDILTALARVVDSGAYILGPEVAGFERALSTQLGVTGAVGVGSGTDALVLALLALEVGPGDEVITVSHTAGPTVAAINMTGATPVLVDIEPSTYCLDPAALEAAVSPRTRAILPVHLYGHPADLPRICEFAHGRGIAVIEDCAQAQHATISGRMVGSFGELGCFSFYPTKNLGAIGDGGAIAATGDKLVERLRRLRTYGWTKPQYAELALGRCSRLDEMQAAILNVKLGHLGEAVERRREIARLYNEAFADLPLTLPVEREDCRHVYHLYVMRSDRAAALEQHLGGLGIGSGRHYPFPVHVQPGLAFGARIPASLTVTETIVGEILTLPLYPSLSSEQQARVIKGVRTFFGKS
jgi:dTDP-3-amino-3,4,6-trideoxy-alpha-D-glucose transaminase